MSAETARLWWRSHLSGVRLINAYGPTEAVISATSYDVGVPTPEAAGVPLGHPLPGRSAYVVDRRGNLQPAGVPGELLLGRAGLARGYLDRPELTAERFVPDPFAEQPGGRLYRTGDLARYLPDGRLDYLGRLDSQVKVRGFRIELGEVEAALLAHPAVRAAVVLASGGSLVAYVETDASAISAGELRALLKGHLPEHMVPSAYRFLEAMPLTGNGKLDRRALAALPLDLGDEIGAVPRTPAEELVAGIFAEVLGVEGVGTGTSFFELGGHSLLAIRVLSRLREAFGVSLPVKALFEAPTVAALAAAVTAARRETSASLLALPPLEAGVRGELLPLSFPQQRLWFMERLAPDNSTYNMPFACEIRGALDLPALAASLTAVVRRHEILRSRFREVDGQPWQEIAPPAPFPLALVDLSALAVERRRPLLARLGREEAARTFDLGRGPLLRAGLVRLAADDHVLLLTQHHIVSDGVSGEILQRDLSLLYAAAVTGWPSPLHGQRVQYGDFALWQRAWPEGMLESQLAYWRETLSGLATLEVPTDRPRPPVLTFRGRTEPVVISGSTATAMRELARAHGVTLFMAFLAVWSARRSPTATVPRSRRLSASSLTCWPCAPTSGARRASRSCSGGCGGWRWRPTTTPTSPSSAWSTSCRRGATSAASRWCR
jgi:acyl carrier protein